METFKPKRLKIEVRLYLFAAIILALFIWATCTGASLLLHRGTNNTHKAADDIAGYQKVDLKALGEFELDAVKGTIKDVPARYRNLDGKKVALDGYMWSPSSSMRAHDFQFIYGFNFKGPPLVQSRVFAHSPVELPLTGDYVRLTGTLHVRIEKNEDGIISSVYTMDVDKCREI